MKFIAYLPYRVIIIQKIQIKWKERKAMDPGDSELNIEECTQNFNLIFEVFVHGFLLIPKWISSAFPKKFQSQWFPRLFYMKYLKNINYYKQKNQCWCRGSSDE